MNAVRRELQAAVDDVQDAVSFIDTAGSLRHRVGPYLRWDILDNDHRALVTDFLRSRANLGLCYEGLLVRLVASFEEFVRHVIRSAVMEINRRGLAFEELDEQLRLRNRYSVGTALATAYSTREAKRFDFDRLCTEVGSCVPGQNVTLSADAMANLTGAISLDGLEKAFDILGTKIDWDQIGREPAVQAAVGRNGPRDARNEAKAWVKDMQKKRNRCAHAGVGGEVIDAADIRRFAVFVEALADEIHTQIRDRVHELVGNG